jgi:hypothetical protein
MTQHGPINTGGHGYAESAWFLIGTLQAQLDHLAESWDSLSATKRGRDQLRSRVDEARTLAAMTGDERIAWYQQKRAAIRKETRTDG